jgi:acyl phosphate:glycerol-3-phosphate acyltransferase
MDALSAPALLAALLALLLAYLIGSLSGSLLLGRLVGVDIRTVGSGNAGGTNAFRTRGWRFALAVVTVDIGKGALAGWLGLRLHADGLPWSAAALGFAAVLAAAVGHAWPLWFGFRGGKGVATLCGGLLLLWPAALGLLLLGWLLLLSATGYVGLASIGATLGLLPLALLAGNDAALGFALAGAAFVLYTHRGNLQRLRAGSEHRFERARLWRRWWRRR